MIGIGGQEMLVLALLGALAFGGGSGDLLQSLLRLGRLAGRAAANDRKPPRPGKPKP